MKKLFLITISILFTFIGYGQKVITVQNGTTSTFYSTIDSAVNAAVTGDNIYIPGGVYSITSITINKGIHIYGAGHYPDSTLATGQTIISGGIDIISGANLGSLSGLYVIGTTRFGSSSNNNTVHNFLINRCSLGRLQMGYTANWQNLNSTNILITENVIRENFYAGECPSLLFKKNILNGSINNSSSANYENNLFLQSNVPCNAHFLTNVNGCSFVNNIISHIPSCGYLLLHNSGANLFTNNLFRGASAQYFPNSTNIEYNNYFGFIDTAVFAGGTSYFFSYTEDYHMLPTCIAHNGGNDNTDPGIYGTSEPYKTAAVPINPHISTKSVPSATDAQGNLNVNIRVIAQDE